MREHTPGRLIAERIPATFNPKMDGFQLVGATPDGIDLMTVALCTVNEADEANARRLVACWNACDLMPTEDVERLAEIGEGVMRLSVLADDNRVERERLSAINAELLEALELADKTMEEISKEMTVGERYTNAGQYLLDTPAVVRAAIAKAQGEQL